MKFLRIVFILSLVGLFSSSIFAQTDKKVKLSAAAAPVSRIRSSPAYAEILLRKTEAFSELESLLVEYTEEYPKVRELRYELGLLQKDQDRLLAANVADASQLGEALGKLMVRKSAIETDLWTLQKEFSDTHPDVKRAKRKAEIFQSAIDEILPPVKKP